MIECGKCIHYLTCEYEKDVDSFEKHVRSLGVNIDQQEMPLKAKVTCETSCSNFEKLEGVRKG